jgi:hypothetical protein
LYIKGNAHQEIWSFKQKPTYALVEDLAVGMVDKLYHDKACFKPTL